MTDNRALVVLSGGLDSTTLAYDLQQVGYRVSAVSFNYGQRHNKELEFARYHAEFNGWSHEVVDISFLGTLLQSSLTGHADIPEGHYAADNMRSTVVPNRNAIMMSIATGIAVSHNIPFIATAVHGGDHFIYPDCREPFIRTLSQAFRFGNESFAGILAPYINHDKNYIAQRAVNLYNWTETWSCYKGGERHCGKCGTCVERMEALWSTDYARELSQEARLATLFPLFEYEDNTYWMQALEEAKK
jgi:7-cyano-7-deazaguanine synthase